MAIRQLFFRKRQTLLTILGIALGTAGTIILSGIMAGFQEYSTEALNEVEPQVKITPREKVKSAADFPHLYGDAMTINWLRPPTGKTGTDKIDALQKWNDFLATQPEVKGFASQVTTIAGFSFAGNKEKGMVIGIEPEKQKGVNSFETKILSGSYAALSQGSVNALIGYKLFKKLGLRLGDMLSVSIPGRFPVELKIVGTIQSGYRYIDEENVYVTLSTAGDIMGRPGEVTTIVVKLHNPQVAKAIALQWTQLFSEKIESWDQSNEGLLASFRIMKIAAFVVSLVIVLVASFGIYSILNMIVNQKKQEIAILRTMGYTKQQIVHLFTIQGAIPGLVGGAIGLILGFFGSQGVEMIPLKQNDEGATRMTFAITHFLVSYDFTLYLRAFVISCATAIAAGFFPARAAIRLAPVDVIRGNA